MPILPIIDLLILMGWTSLFAGFALKGIYISTSYRPTLLGAGPLDLVILAGIFLLFSLALAARTWVKLHDQQVRADGAKATATLEAYARLQGDSGAAASNGLSTNGAQADDRPAEVDVDERDPQSVRA